MAFGYKANYGYFQNGITSGTTTIEDMTVTDQNKWFVVPETYTEPYVMVPPVATIDLAQAHENGKSITEYLGATLLPKNCFNTVYQTYAAGTVQAIIDFMPSAFRECPNLLAHEIVPHTLEGDLHRTCVYLYDINKVITDNNQVFNVTSDGKLIYAGQSWRCTCGNFSGYPNTQVSAVFTAQAMDIENVGGYECEFIANETGQYLVYYNLNTETIDADTWETKKNGTFGTEDPEWSRNPFDKDPYNPVNPGAGGPSTPGGGGGTFDFDSDNVVPLPDVDDLMNITTTDLVSVYSPSAAQLHQLAGVLWSRDFVEGIFKTKYDPFDVIIGLHVVPVPLSGEYHTLTLGNITTELVFKKVSNQFYKKSFGGMKIDEIWGAYLDYMCRIQIFLPFIGFVSISPDDVFGHLLSVDYIVDAVTGGCVAFIRRDNECIATYGGNCAYQIPITGANYSAINSAIINAVVVGVGAIAGVATGGLAAPLAIGAVAGSSINAAAAKPDYERSGSLTANIGYMGMRTPYLLVYAPNQCVPEMQNSIKGYPAWITRSLGAVHGYTEVDTVHLDGITATDAEKDDIMAKLKAGVIL